MEGLFLCCGTGPLTKKENELLPRLLEKYPVIGVNNFIKH